VTAPIPPGPAEPVPLGEGSRTWAVAAHLSSIVAMLVALAFVGPLVVYLVKKDEDPFVRAHAAESLNFQLSWLIYAIAVTILFLVATLLVPVAIAAAVAWLVLIVVASVRAGRGQLYRYPLTIHFLR
jgi:uncharacterized Tic20 family protein